MSEKIAEQYKVKTEPFYRPVSNEVELYQACLLYTSDAADE